MNTTIPWWGSGLFTIAGTLIGALVTLGLGLLNRRSERHRLSRERKEADYPQLVSLLTEFARKPVWTRNSGSAGEDDLDFRFNEIHALVQKVAFFSPAKVTNTLAELLSATAHLRDTVVEIHAESRPIHGDGVDQRYAERHRDAVSRLEHATSTFATAARADLEIDTPQVFVNPDSQRK